MRTIPNDHSPFFRAAMKTNPYSQTFITAVKRQKNFSRNHFSLSSTQCQRKRNLRNDCMKISKQPMKSSQHRQTSFHHPATFFHQQQAIIINYTAFLNQINIICSSMNNGQMKNNKNITNQRNTNCRNNLFTSSRRIYQQVFHHHQQAFYQQLRRRSNTSKQKEELMFVINLPH